MINSRIRHTIYLTQEEIDTIEDMNFPAIPFEDDSTIEGALINGILSQIVDPANRDIDFI
tara:strand:- start:1433 stop:1612 length:180 start_codon:yes stop_codon:yes gene_type:complete